MAIAYIPYGAYWCSPFARWQGAFAHLHSVKFAAHVTRDAMAARGLTTDLLDYCAYGYTVIQPNIFYGAPWFSALIGAEGLPGPTVNQACATGPRLIATAPLEVATPAPLLCLPSCSSTRASTTAPPRVGPRCGRRRP